MRFSPLLFSIAVALPLSSCIPTVSVSSGNYTQNKTPATTAVERFHSQYNADEFMAIYYEADVSFQSTMSQKAFLATMRQTKESYGEVIDAICIGENTFPNGQVRLAYNVKFQKGEATELFIWQSDGKKARLHMSEVSPGQTPPIIQSRP